MMKRYALPAIGLSLWIAAGSHLSGQAWIEGTWSARVVSISSDDEMAEVIEAADAITIAQVSAGIFDLTTPDDEGGLETTRFELTEREGFYSGSVEGFLNDDDSYDFDFLRLYPIDANTGVIMLFGTGGSDANLGTIYWMDATIGIISRSGVPAAASLDGRAGVYRGFASGVDISGGVDPFIESVGLVDVVATGNSYTIDPNDADGAELLERGNGFLFYDDFSPSGEGEMETLAILPITSTLMVFARFEGDAFRAGFSGEFQNFSYATVEAGIVSSDPSFVLPSYVAPPSPELGPVVHINGDWVMSSWLGLLYGSEFPWIYSPRFGWVRMYTGGPEGAYFYDAASGGYFWTSEDSSPYRYRLPSGPWE